MCSLRGHDKAPFARAAASLERQQMVSRRAVVIGIALAARPSHARCRRTPGAEPSGSALLVQLPADTPGLGPASSAPVFILMPPPRPEPLVPHESRKPLWPTMRSQMQTRAATGAGHGAYETLDQPRPRSTPAAVSAAAGETRSILSSARRAGDPEASRRYSTRRRGPLLASHAQ
jgi:hypothetical protein